jgi:hypothetical protein
MEKRKRGRPRAVDWKENEAKIFGRFRATHKTMAEFYGVSTRTIDRLMEDEKSVFCRIYKKALAMSIMSLHEAQFKSAVEDRNAALLIWLGKQYLGQSDAPINDGDDSDALTIIRVGK